MKLSLLCFIISMLNEMIAAKYLLVDVEEPTVPALQSRSGRGGTSNGWTPFQRAAKKNKRGKLIRIDRLSGIGSGDSGEGQAISACRAKCDSRPECCMQSMKAKGEVNYFCYLYDAKFGGSNEKFIEGVSTRRGNDQCAYKDESHSGSQRCMAQ